MLKPNTTGLALQALDDVLFFHQYALERIVPRDESLAQAKGECYRRGGDQFGRVGGGEADGVGEHELGQENLVRATGENTRKRFDDTCDLVGGESVDVEESENRVWFLGGSQVSES